MIPTIGIVRETVPDLAQRLLAEHGGLRGLFCLELVELSRIRSAGDAKAAWLKDTLVPGADRS